MTNSAELPGPTLRRLAVTTALLAAATALATPPAGATGPAAANSRSFPVTCQVVPGGFGPAVSGSRPVSVTVTAPTSAGPGEEFDVAIDAGTVTVPNHVSGLTLTGVSRVKLDLAAPSNAEVLAAWVTDPGSLTAGAPATVARVNEAGVPDPHGAVLRLAGDNAAIGNAPGASGFVGGGAAAVAGQGDRTTVALPKVMLRLRALGGPIEIRLRTAGPAANVGAPEAFLTMLPNVSGLSAPTTCTPRDGADAPLNAGAPPLAVIGVPGGGAPTLPSGPVQLYRGEPSDDVLPGVAPFGS